MNRNKHLIPLPFCHPHYRAPHLHHTSGTASSTRLFPKLLFVMGSRVKVNSLKLSPVRVRKTCSKFLFDIYRRRIKIGYKSWATLLKMLNCCQYLSMWLLAVTVRKYPYTYCKSLPSCTAAGSN